MKTKMKCFMLHASFFMAATLFAAANDTLISFSTPGPDTYADGTTVKDGECYALVWTKTGATFAGLAADGKVVDATNSAVLVYAPVAKDGRCPTVVFELDAEIASQYADGGYGVYLLDTRLANGKVGGVGANGKPVAVNGYGDVAAASLPHQEGGSISSLARQDASSTVSVTTKSALPADAPKPQITSIRIVGANVVLTVKNTLPCLQYKAAEVAVGGDVPGAPTAGSQEVSPCQPTQGAASTDEEITVIVPKKGDSGFFTVGRE